MPSSACEMRPPPVLSERRAVLRRAAARPCPWRSNVNRTRELAVTTFKLKYTGATNTHVKAAAHPTGPKIRRK